LTRQNELLEAVYIADFDRVKFLLSQNKNSFKDFANRQDNHGRVPLMLCGLDPQFSMEKVDQICVQIAKVLKHHGANLSHTDNYGWNSLSMSAVRGMPRMTSYLINNGLDVNYYDYNRTTSLMLSAAHGHYHTFEFLLRKGSNVSMLDVNGLSAVHHAVRLAMSNSSYISFVRSVLSIIGSVDEYVDFNRRTPLMYSVIGNQISSLLPQLLLEAGSDPRRVDAHGISAISMCNDYTLRSLLSEYAARIAEDDYKRWRSRMNFKESSKSLSSSSLDL
jgi:ankyrin repeat protein